MRDLLISGLAALPTLFVVVDPMSAAPVFLALTAGRDRAARAAIALRAAVTAGLVLILFAILGAGLFRFFGISMASFQIAGGLLLLRIGAQMVAAGPSSTPRDATPTPPADPSISPIAIPLLAGPGAITSVLVLTSRAENWAAVGAVVTAVAIVMFASWAILRVALSAEARLSPRVMNVIEPIIGLLLAAIGVELVASAARELVTRS